MSSVSKKLKSSPFFLVLIYLPFLKQAVPAARMSCKRFFCSASHCGLFCRGWEEERKFRGGGRVKMLAAQTCSPTV